MFADQYAVLNVNYPATSCQQYHVRFQQPLEWIAKYGSVTFNQFGKEFPYGGINEKGLVIEIMVAKADYENFDNRKAINELQWIQYQLDNAKSIDEVISSKSKLRISPIDQELHFLICDSGGNVAAIEFRNGAMVVYRNNHLPIEVLENDLYSKSLEKHRKNIECRFSTATNMINNYRAEIDGSIIDLRWREIGLA